MKTFFSSAAIVSCVLLMLAIAPAGAASFGHTTAGTNISGGLRADFKRGSRFVLSEKAMMNGVCAYLDGKGGGTGLQELRYAVYRDNHGVPGDRVVETDSFGIEAGDSARWICAGGSFVPLDPGAYWIVIHSGSNAGLMRYYYDGPANWYGNFDEYADGSSDAFGAGGTGDGTMSIYVDYTRPADLHIAGNTTVGSVVSSPMSGGFKRGSSFVLTEKADLSAMVIYVDSLGGSTGEQALSVAVYDDANGEPSGLVAQGWALVGVDPGGRKGRWVTALPAASNLSTPNPASMMPGRYWIVIQSGSPGGEYRYYMEGQGNWRGNASPGDTAPPLFGKASPGNGTISAFILYSPSQVEHKTIGLTTPGTAPSSGLSANFIRGSLFGQDPFFDRAQVTALWAYLDGNGGASGSQKVRLALYEQPLDQNDRLNVKAVSEEVTIAAGTPPGWVRFAIPYTRIFDYIHGIMILSSGPGGVVRNYSTNEYADWYGMAADYTQGPPGIVWLEPNAELPHPVLQRGSVTVSVYAEYLVTQ